MYPTTEDLQDIFREDLHQLEKTLSEIRERAERAGSGEIKGKVRRSRNSSLKDAPSGETAP